MFFFLLKYTFIVKVSYVHSLNNLIIPNPDISSKCGALTLKTSFLTLLCVQEKQRMTYSKT